LGQIIDKEVAVEKAIDVWPEGKEAVEAFFKAMIEGSCSAGRCLLKALFMLKVTACDMAALSNIYNACFFSVLSFSIRLFTKRTNGTPVLTGAAEPDIVVKKDVLPAVRVCWIFFTVLTSKLSVCPFTQAVHNNMPEANNNEPFIFFIFADQLFAEKVVYL
jgi:hypothetical protein